MLKPAHVEVAVNPRVAFRSLLLMAVAGFGLVPVWGAPLDCSSSIPNSFAPAFGSMVGVCGNVTVSSTQAMASAAVDYQPAAELNAFLGRSQTFSDHVIATAGSAFQFVFTTSAPVVVEFVETSQTAGPNASFTFLSFDGQLIYLLEALGTDRSFVLHGAEMRPAGQHVLAFGAAIGCPIASPGCSIVSSNAGPSITVSSLVLTEIPEPASWILGMWGVAGWAIWSLLQAASRYIVTERILWISRGAISGSWRWRPCLPRR